MTESRKSNLASWIVVGLTLLAMVATVIYIGGTSEKALAAPPFAATPPLDEAADFFLKFTDLQGRVQSLEEYRGKTIVLNFWATWCAPCRREMPSLGRLVQHYAKSPDVAVLCLSDEPVAIVKKAASVDGMAMPVFSYASELPPVYGEQGVPRTYIISPEGRVVFLLMGPADWSDPAVFAYLDKLTVGKEG